MRHHSGSSTMRCMQYESAMSLLWEGRREGMALPLPPAACCILLRARFSFSRSTRKMARDQENTTVLSSQAA